MYIVIEIQAYESGDIGYIVDKKATKSAAWQRYHQVLAAAAVSGLPSHSCVILDPLGNVLAHDYFINGAAHTEE